MARASTLSPPAFSRSASGASFVRRAYLWLALGCAVIVATSTIVEVARERAGLEGELAARLHVVDLRAASALAAPLAAGDLVEARAILETLSFDPDFAGARILDDEGRMVLELSTDRSGEQSTGRVPIPSLHDHTAAIGSLEFSLSQDGVVAHIQSEVILAAISAAAQLVVLLVVLIS